MSDLDATAIPLSRTKMLLLAFACVLFVAVGFWLFTLDDAFIEKGRRFGNPLLVHGVGAVGMAVFGLLSIMIARKLLDTRPGLVLNRAGLLDNSSASSVGLVPWSDVVGLEVHESFKQRMLVVKVAEPDRYLETGNPLTRYLRKSSHKMCGSPVSINTASLKLGFDELLALVQQYNSRYGRPD